METEDFRIIPSNPAYRISRSGKVQSRWKRIGQGRGKAPKLVLGETWHDLTCLTDAAGYAVVALGRRRRGRIANLLLDAFVGPRPAGQECRHLDGDRSNDSLENLAWGTSAENTEDQRRHGTLIGGERHGMAKLTNADVDKIRRMAGTMTQRKIGEIFGVSQCHVSDIIHERRRTKSSHEGRGL